MSDALDREEVIALLDRLGDEQDEEVLKAAREVHRRVAASEVTWDDLLVSDATDPVDPYDDADDYDPDYDSDEADDDDSDPDEAVESPKTAAAKEKRNEEALALIEQLLARDGVSDDLKAELEDYKVDIAEDEFAPADHRYIRALHKRLSGAKSGGKKR